MTKVLVIRAEMGRITESRIVEGELYEVLKNYVSIALSEWDPGVSDFVVIREDLNVEVESALNQEILESLRTYGSLKESEGVLEARIPVYTISFDNRSLGEEMYVENKIYVISLYINEDIRVLLESEAASITVQGTPPEGISSV